MRPVQHIILAQPMRQNQALWFGAYWSWRRLKLWLLVCILGFSALVHAQTSQQVVDLPSRLGVVQRILVLSPPNPKAAVILMAGGHGGLQISPSGAFKWGEGNFLVRTRQLFADQGLTVAVLDAPSDRLNPPFLSGFRQTPEHVADIQAVIAWLREHSKVPVWLVGTSRGTQSAAHAAIEMSGSEGPDGLVLTSTILTDPKSRPVTAMALSKLRIPVLVVHHERDGCQHCQFRDTAALMEKLSDVARKDLLSFTEGTSRGDPCEAWAYHGFNGIESEVVTKIAAWILAL